MTLKIVKKRTPVLTTNLKYVVSIDHELFELSRYFIEALDSVEGQWYSLLEADYSEKDQGYIYYKLKDLFIPKQTVTTVEVDSTDQEMSEMWMNIKKERGLTGAEITKLITNAGAWCHSHVKAEAKPTATDETLWKKMIDKAVAPKAMLIFNQPGDIYCRIYDPNLDHLIIENPSVVIDSTFRYKMIEEAIATLVTKKTMVIVSKQGSGSGPLVHTGSSSQSQDKSTGDGSMPTEITFNYLGKAGAETQH